MGKKILYIDMDNTIVDFKSGIKKLSIEDQKKFKGKEDEHPEIFSLMEPVEGAVAAMRSLHDKYDMYILSTAPWENSNAWRQKREWIEKYFGKKEENLFFKKVILTHNKHLNKGDILIDDRPHNGAKEFSGEWIQFGSKKYPNWKFIVQQLLEER